jgi:hypothetical protein
MHGNYHAFTEQLVATLTADSRGGGPDNLDPLRRFDYHDLEQAMRLGPAAAATALLELYEREAGGDARAVEAVCRVT